MNIEERAVSIIKNMSITEKIGQLTQYMFSVKDAEKLKDKAREGKVGSIVLSSTAFAGNDEQEKLAHELLDEIQRCAVQESKCKIPILFGRDVIHGHKVVYPIPLAMSAAFNPKLTEECYECIAEEAASDGVRWAFAPMLDIARDPRWGRCIESPGEDPYLGECAAKAIVKGFQKNKKLAACAKHYVGYGASEGGRDYHRTEISDYTLRNYYLRAFKSAVDAGASTVMTSFNDISGQPVTSSKYLITDVLKKELGFDGFVVSDWAAIEQLENQGVAENRKECAELAINAGIDMDMCDFCYEEYLQELVNESKVDIQTIDEAVLRVLKIKLKYELFEKPYTNNTEYGLKKHLKKAYEAASESMVLLKNEGVLPIKKGVKAALIGPMLDEKRSLLGSWTMDGDLKLVSSFRETVLNELTKENVFVSDSDLYDEMLINIRKSDVVIACLGESHKVTGEMHSLSDIDIPKGQLELVRAAYELGKPIIGVMFFGRPIGLEKIEPYLSGILWAWHSGTMTAQAAADILFGKTNPSGKLSMTLPRRTGQIPIYYNVTPSGRAVNGYYGEEMYQNYDDCLGSPMYPFGYGMSYAGFEYIDVSADRNEMTVDDIKNGNIINICAVVRNTGTVDGKEAVQLYIRDEFADMMRPMRELKAIKKINVKKGETVTVCFEVGEKELGYYNSEGIFAVEPGDFMVYIGGDCYAKNGIRLRITNI